MSKTLICYSLEKTKASKRTLLHRNLYGYTDFSNHGKYSYQREGILHKTGSQRITDAVILAPKSQANKIITILEKFGAKVFKFSVIQE